MKRRLIAIFLTISIVLGVSGTAFAAEGGIAPHASAYLDTYYVTLAAKGNGRMVIGVSVDGVGVQDKIGILSVDIYVKENGKWIIFDMMDSVDHPEFYTYKSRDHVGEISFYGTPGASYYATITVVSFKDGGGDTGYITSPAVVCK